MNRVACLVQGNGYHDRDLILRAPTYLAARAFSAKVGIIDLNLSSQYVGIIAIAHCPQNLVMQQLGPVVVHVEMAGQLERRDACFGLPD